MFLRALSGNLISLNLKCSSSCNSRSATSCSLQDIRIPQKIASTWLSNDSTLSLLSTEHFAQRALSLVWAEQSGSSDSGWEPALLCTWLPEAERKEVFVYESSGLSGWPASQAVSFNFSAGL